MDNTDLCCVICNEDFSDEILPRNLQCGHSLCTACIDNVILSDTDNKCPECRVPFITNNASDLSVNYPLLRLARSFTASTSNLEDLSESSAASESESETITKGENKLFIDDYGTGPIWRQNPSEFTCTVSSPNKQSKYHGMKNYVAYTVIPSFSSKRVLRRFKHFSWLQNQLIDRYPLILMPPLPEKQLLGRFSEELIEYRKRMLQSWLDRVCHHPVISQSDIFHLFITVSNKKSWKTSKRKSENGGFYSTIKLPDSSVDLRDMEQKLEEYDHFSSKLNKSLKSLQTACMTQTNYKAVYQQENNKVSHAFMKLSQAFNTDITHCGPELPSVISHVSEAYSDIGKMYAEESEQGWGSLQNLLLEYQGLVEGFDKILGITKKSITNWRTKEDKLLDLGDLASETDKTALAAASEGGVTVAYAFQAETAHFHEDRTRDFKKSLQSFLNEQINFHQLITNRLKESLEKVSSEDMGEASAPSLELFS